MKLTDYTSWLLPIWYLVSPKLGFQIKSQQMTFVEVNILIIFHAFNYKNAPFNLLLIMRYWRHIFLKRSESFIIIFYIPEYHI